MDLGQTSNIVQLLRKDPMFYRNFGIWWWHVKAELRRAGHGPDVLPHLGGYMDPNPAVAEAYDGKTPAELDYLAFAEAELAARVQRNQAEHVGDDGETYTVFDEDVGV